MPVIDADTHIDENEQTWSYVEEPFQALAAVTEVRPAGTDIPSWAARTDR